MMVYIENHGLTVSEFMMYENPRFSFGEDKFVRLYNATNPIPQLMFMFKTDDFISLRSKLRQAVLEKKDILLTTNGKDLIAAAVI
jgi:hypothetical protein